MRVRALFSGGRRERELAAEIESHLQLHIDDNIRAGMTLEEARRAALVKFGPVESLKEDYRDRAGIPFIEMFLQDLRYAARRLVKQPGFALLVVLTLALGVGANAAMFGLVDALMFRMPEHVREPRRLVGVQGAGTYVRYQEFSDRIASVEFAAYTIPQTLSLGAGATALPLRTQCVTPTFFPLLGTSSLIGRTFGPGDDGPGSEGTIVLSHGVWSRHFGADAGAIDKTLVIANRPYRVIGIARKGFKGLELQPVDAWILLAVSPEACSFTGTNLLRASSGSWLNLIGRLRDGVTFAQATSELTAAEVGQAPISPPGGRVSNPTAAPAPLYPWRRLNPSLARDGRLALWLAGGASVLLLLACANIAGLLSMRAIDRRREIAIRLQLGGSRRRIFGQLLVEHLLTAGLGGLAAILVAVWLGTAFRKYLPFGGDAEVLDLRILAVLAGLAVTAGVLSGTIPAMQASRSMAAAHLRTGRTVAAGRSRLRTGLLIAQVASALVLVVGAGLFVRSVQNFRRDFAYDLDHVVTAAIDVQRSGHAPGQQIHATFERLLSAVRQLPQVESAALSSSPVLGAGGMLHVYFVRRSRDDGIPSGHSMTEVTPEYFATLGLDIIRGRTFAASDSLSGRRVIILNETLAAQLFPREDAIGKCVLVSREDCTEVVGISKPFRATIRPTSQGDSQVFMPLRESADSHTVPQVLLVRTRKSAAGEVASLAAALQGVSPDLPYISVRPLLELADAEARSWLLGATVFSLFGALAVMVAGIGIYGTLAFSIRQRTTEIGIRLALGARRSDVARMVLRHGALVVTAGCALGAAAAYGGSRFAGSLLFKVAPADPTTFAVAAGVIVIAALAGCLIPAVRAARVDPVVALRYD
jgi:predicted permease